MLIIYCFIFGIILINNIPAQNPSFNSPVDIPLFLSGNFGELRADHFHSGIDIRTQGTIGKKVYAVEDGYVSRIKVQTGGYGKSVYINHISGYTSVYAHLDAYNDEIDAYLKSIQYKKKSYTVDIYPENDALPVLKGEFIALSGNSGSSGGPHLHFELRNSANQNPINPLTFGFDIKDITPPKISSIFVYQEDNIQKMANPVEYAVKLVDGTYKIASDKAIRLTGKGGFGIQVFDYLNYSSHNFGIYTIELSINNIVVYLYRADEFSFEESRYVNAHIDYSMEISKNRKINLLFRKPNNKLSMYPVMVRNGIFDFLPGEKYNIKIVAADTYGNDCKLEFDVEGVPVNILAEKTPDASKLIFYSNSNNYFEEGMIHLDIPVGSLYENMIFEYSRNIAKNGRYTHFIGNPLIPLHLPAALSINEENIPVNLRSKTIIIRLEEDDEFSVMRSFWHGSRINSNIPGFGKYTVEIDTIPPQIKSLNLSSGISMADKKDIRFNITDKLSGIVEYNGYIDNNWVLFEYDPKNDLVLYNFDKNRLKSGQKHELMFYVKDATGNQSVFNSNFIW